MERDFLAAIGKGQQQQQQPQEKRRREDSAYFGGGGGGVGGGGGAAAPTAMDWSFSSKPAAAPALMSFRSAPREEQREHAFPHPHFAAFDGATAPAPRVPTHQRQRSFGADGHGSPQYAAVHREQQHVMNGARAIPASSPFNQNNNPMFRVQSSPTLPNGVAGGAPFKQPPFALNNHNPVPNSTVGVYGTSDAHKPKTAQLTIFYAGTVNVFDNVSAETAQELMFIASRGSLPSSAPVARKPEAPIFPPPKVTVPEVSPAKQMVFQTPQHVSPPPSAISKPISGVLQAPSLPRSASSPTVDSTGPKSSSPLAVPPISQAPPTQPAALATKTAAAIMPRAVPQARKASLARFLEKRKERVTKDGSEERTQLARRFYVVETRKTPRPRVGDDVSGPRDDVSGDYGVTTAAPYSSAKSPLESSDTMGSANEKSSCTDIALSSNREESLCLGQPRNISFGQEPPSTKLQI